MCWGVAKSGSGSGKHGSLSAPDSTNSRRTQQLCRDLRADICSIPTTAAWKEGCVFDTCFAGPEHAPRVGIQA